MRVPFEIRMTSSLHLPAVSDILGYSLFEKESVLACPENLKESSLGFGVKLRALFALHERQKSIALIMSPWATE